MVRIALLLLLALSNTVSRAEVDVEKLSQDTRERYVMWSWACELTMLCDGRFSPPTIVDEEMSGGLRGYYEGDDVIHVNSKLRKGYERSATVLHEMVHYIHSKYELVKIPYYYATVGAVEQACWSEATAFAITDEWLEMEGQSGRKRGPNWWKPYWHCEPYYNPDWDLWPWLVRMPV